MELDYCEEKIKNLTSYIADIQSKPEKATFRRFFSRLCHLHNRLNFVVPKTDSDTERKTYYMARTDQLRTQLEEREDLVEHANSTADEKQELEETLGDIGKLIIGKLEKTDRKNTTMLDTRHQLDNSGNETSEKPQNLERSRVAQTTVIDSHTENAENIILELPSHSKFSRLARTSTVDFENTEKILKRKLVPISQ